ncbi:hypothetical protein Vadar_034041 [Vaccinium darrowii]|uniref:Uncharacterized protein n=1 Tax=Vaccinium darrowii TaxID=229202 RepID=A0ACB7ZNL4_9ERIC|nr:hypothetical protein Vadar_034041 [Vaccinium darrowii]
MPNYVFVQGADSVTRDRRQNGRSTNCDGENSDEGRPWGVTKLKQNVDLFERKIEQATASLKAKDAKVIGFEYAQKSNESPKEETGSTIKSQQEKYREMEAELEGSFKQKIEAEVKYLAISRTIPKVRVAAVDQAAVDHDLDNKLLEKRTLQAVSELEALVLTGRFINLLEQ